METVYTVILVDSGQIRDAVVFSDRGWAVFHAKVLSEQHGWDRTQPWYDWIDETQYDIAILARPVHRDRM